PKSSTGESRDIGKITNSSECPSQSIAEIKAIKDKIDGVFVIVNKLCYSTTRLLNEFSAILARKDLHDSTTQTDFEVHNNVGLNIADATNAIDNQCTYTLSGLSTEIEGLKLNIIITESNILSKVQSNNQAIEQIRHDLDSIKSHQSKSNFISDNNTVPITNSESINVGPTANSTKIDSTATIPICKHGSNQSCAQLRSTVICQQNTNPPGVAQFCSVSSNKPNNKLTHQAYPNSNKHVTQQIEGAPGINKGQQNHYKVCKSTSDHKLETPKANPEVIKIGSTANTTKALSVGAGSAKHESKQYYAHHYNLVSPVKQSNSHQHSQAVFRPQSNVSCVKPKPRNKQNVQHISNLSCANTGESQPAPSGTGSLKWLARLPLVETLNAT
ncbi:Hypothetical predicted protein, partial [Paramuricea clavata]